MDCISNAAEAAAQRQSAVSCQVWLAAGLLQLARLAGGRRESSGGPPLALGRLLSSAAAAWPLLAAGPLYHMDEAAHSRTSGCATWDSPAACYRWLLLLLPSFSNAAPWCLVLFHFEPSKAEAFGRNHTQKS
jgi:hypothetical protein